VKINISIISNYLIVPKTVVLSLSFDTFVALIPVSPFTGLKVKAIPPPSTAVSYECVRDDPPAGVFFQPIAKAPFTLVKVAVPSIPTATLPNAYTFDTSVRSF
jgi:hypothetical protein